MKLRNIIYALVAGASIFASCTKEVKRDSLDVLKVDKTFVSIDKMGGTATLIINATADWHIVDSVVVKNKKESAFPEGLTIEPLVGLRGETKVTFTSPDARKKAAKCQIEIICEGQSQFVLFNMEAGAPSPYPDFKAGKYWLMFQQEDGSWLASQHCTASIDDAGSYGYVSCEPASGKFPDLSSTANNIFTFEAVDGGYIIKDVEGGYLYQDAAGKYNNFYRTSEKGKAMIWSVEQDSETEYYITSTQGKWIQYSTGYSTWGAYNSKQDKALLPYLVEAKDPAPEVIKLESQSVSVEKEETEFIVKAKINADQIKVDFDADWLSYYGTNNEGLIFKAAANNGAPRSAEVKITASLKQGEKTYSGDAKFSVAQGGNKGDIKDITLNNPCYIEGVVTAINARGFVVSDGTASVLYYLASGFDATEYPIGTKVVINCTKVTYYGGALQLEGGNCTVTKDGTAEFTYPQPVVYDKAKLDAYVSSSANDFAEYITFTATASISGNYYNFLISEGDTHDFSLYQGTAEQKAGIENGKTYVVEGYLVSRSSGSHANVVFVKYEEGTPGPEPEPEPEPEIGLAETSWYQYANDPDGGFAILTFMDEENCYFANGDKEGIWWEDVMTSAYTYDATENLGSAFDGTIGFQIGEDGKTLITAMGSFEKGEYVPFAGPEPEPGELVYSLETANVPDGSNNSYAGNCDIEVDGIVWNLQGNSTMHPWRIGGKSLEGVDRTVYTKTAWSTTLSKIVVAFGFMNDITVNSATLVYSTKEDFSEAKELPFTPAATSEIEIIPEGGFPANCYYKFVFNVTVTATSNKYIQFNGVEFYK
ncbi:MAG: hypothetical protein MJY92_01165 [Bacteroidales bacterium]|nr:hypothetical protein [Bacteroidales bacterium]